MSKARQLADLGNQIDDGAITGSNMVVNGAMTVAQRGTSFTGLANSPEYTADRFEFRRINAWSTGRFAVTHEADGPAGFGSSIKLATTTAETDTSSIAALATRLEGQDCQSLKYGSSSAKSVTLSFWVKSFQTGTYGFALNVANLNQSIYGTLYAINQSNTWEYKTITIPAPALAATTAINNDTAQGLELIWHFTYRDSAGTLTNNSWDETTGSGATRWYSVNGQTINGSTSTSNYLQITGVCLNVGDSAIDFPHDESYGDTLAKCQRYFEQINYETNYSFIGVGVGASGTVVQAEIKYSKKRTAPSVSGTGTFMCYDGTDRAVTSQSFAHVTSTRCTGFFNSSNISSGRAYKVQFHSSGDRNIRIDAEL